MIIGPGVLVVLLTVNWGRHSAPDLIPGIWAIAEGAIAPPGFAPKLLVSLFVGSIILPDLSCAKPAPPPLASGVILEIPLDKTTPPPPPPPGPWAPPLGWLLLLNLTLPP